jgi:hypothetical protein
MARFSDANRDESRFWVLRKSQNSDTMIEHESSEILGENQSNKRGSDKNLKYNWVGAKRGAISQIYSS